MSRPDESCLRMAAEIEAQLLPKKSPELIGGSVAGWTIYSEMLGGDFYDYHDFTGACCNSPTRLGVVVGDSCGHGLCSALIMTSTRSLFRGRAMMRGTVAAVARDVNRLLYLDINSSGHFVTAFYATIDTDSRTVQWVRAGHPPARVFLPDSNRYHSLKGEGLALGVEKNQTYKQDCYAIPDEGAVILIGSDGFWELSSLLGRGGLEVQLPTIVKEHRGHSAVTVASALKKQIMNVRKGRPGVDDITLVIIMIDPCR